MAFNDLSEAPAEVCVTTKSPELLRPAGLTVLSRTDTSLTIRWTDNADGEDNYRFTWGLATDATVTHVATVAAHPGVGGEMTYTAAGGDQVLDRLAVGERDAPGGAPGATDQDGRQVLRQQEQQPADGRQGAADRAQEAVDDRQQPYQRPERDRHQQEQEPAPARTSPSTAAPRGACAPRAGPAPRVRSPVPGACSPGRTDS
ncbi:hypothetical protein [Dactylosporangium sp. NPDC006015]|uniref:hypothetical protein n=1 Tax=Dactylosporangium sp. NPDC006015 TaxID=3154576 RepID=UPI0033A3FB64